MLESIVYFANLMEVEVYWVILIIALLILLGIVLAIYCWNPVAKSVETKEKDGTIVKKYYLLKK